MRVQYLVLLLCLVALKTNAVCTDADEETPDASKYEIIILTNLLINLVNYNISRLILNY